MTMHGAIRSDGSILSDGPGDAVSEQIRWMSTKEAAEHLGVTLRSLYRFIDEGALPAFKFGRVIRLKADDVDAFIENCRIAPGSLEHLYPEVKGSTPVRGRAEGL